MIFKRKHNIPTLINIYSNENKSLVLDLNTITLSKIYNQNEKYYINVLIDDKFMDMFDDIIQECECYMMANNLKLKRCIDTKKDILKIKIMRRYGRFQLKVNSDNFITPSTIDENMNVTLRLHLEYIWMNDKQWGLVWKCKEIDVN